jgi:hypothetical protein
MQKYELMRGVVLAVIGTILVGFAARPVTAQVSFDQIVTANATCAVEGQALIVIPIGTGQVNGCSDGVRGTETIAVIDARPLESLPLLFAVGNFPCSGTQLVTFRNIVEETVAAVGGIAADGGQQINVWAGAEKTPPSRRGMCAAPWLFHSLSPSR